ncbi:hypothetical protein [Silvimonas sp.]|uniref:hypothetical protein n=1 Tax=Silvimonas sp. TaxID=2650811 RepID=UPI00284332E0|nr:hypothetical protein [Silvimonas sp.]MDR3428220.1 hypothetical protein [Silvimonas sp.]
MESLASRLLGRGDEICIEQGQIIIHAASGKPVPREWLSKNAPCLVQEILAALGTAVAYEYCDYTTGSYGKHKAGGVTLQFQSLLTCAKAYVIFNAELTRSRTTKAAKKGTPLPKGHFRIGKRSHFYQFWKSTGLAEPKRLSSFHDYMGNLKGILFTAKLQYNRMDAGTLKPLSISAHVVRAAFMPDFPRTISGHAPGNCQAKVPDKGLAQDQRTQAFQAKWATCGEDYGNTASRRRGYK